LLLLAAGTGLGPIWGVLREALRQGHEGAIRLMHVARDGSEHYLADQLRRVAVEYPQFQFELIDSAGIDAAMAGLRIASRQTVALVCGSPESVERYRKRLYIAGMPRGQVLADVFVERE
jgi:ferredoxin-NADP reductase